MLKEIIEKKIAEKGKITFKEFMELCLYHPLYGYYSKAPSIGKEGDFYTSPSVGGIFGRTLARVFSEMLSICNGNIIVELGAGSGDLARDIMSWFCEKKKSLPEYIIIEKSPGLIERQREKLKGFRVRWLSELEELEPITGVIFSNEFFDALPVHIVEKREGKLYEVYVSLKGREFCEVLDTLSCSDISAYFEMLNINLPDGFRTEVNLEALKWLDKIASVIEKGFHVVIDYGYPSTELYQAYRSRGTLMCYFKHRAVENPYERVGEQDITSHVNFSALKIFGERFGLEFTGFTNQANFLIDGGILEEAGENDMLKVKTLILPGGMGETFKVLVQHKGFEEKPVLSCLKNAPRRASYEL